MPKTAPVRKRTRQLQNTSSPSAIVAGSNDPRNALELAITYVPPDTLTPPPRKLRKNPARQMSAIRASVANFGFINPILVDATGRIICGHARWLVAGELGLATVPVIQVDHLSEEEKRLYAIAENQTGALGEWDEDALRLEFGELIDLTVNLDFSVELSGFSFSEIDDLVIAEDPGDGASGDMGRHADVTKLGDLWVLDDHRLLCGDSLEEESYTVLMGEDRAQMVFCDSPYNQPVKVISGKGKVKHPEFANASGELSVSGFTGFLTTVFDWSAKFSLDGAIHYQCMDWHHMREMQDAGQAVYSELKNLIVWDKGKGGQGGFYRSQHELIFVWKVGKARHINNFGMGETGRYRTNVWAYRGNNSFHAGRDEELAAHPTVKPLALVADALRDCSHPGGIVLDPFGGSGTTLLAAEHTGRHARLIEIEPKYCDGTIERWQRKTGMVAVLAATGQTWFEVAAERGIDLEATAPGDPDLADDSDVAIDMDPEEPDTDWDCYAASSDDEGETV
ncbi:MAG TPA: DNA methyltransferase [Croceicoccus sp.]|nr:DNA methyltransferase [Croceicoccus sp.]